MGLPERMQPGGTVSEQNELFTRCAALSLFGLSDEERAERPYPADANPIYHDEEFEVTPAS